MADSTQALDYNSFSNLDADEVLDMLTAMRAAIAIQKERLAALLERLEELAAAGKIDHGGFSHNDWSFAWSAGRRTWSYPPAVAAIEQQLKAAQKTAEADGSATATTGASFWTIKPPKS